MMFNRALQVKVIKSNKKDEPQADQTDATYEGKVAIVGHFVERAIKRIGITVITYVVVDTIRQVMVAQANQTT